MGSGPSCAVVSIAMAADGGQWAGQDLPDEQDLLKLVSPSFVGLILLILCILSNCMRTACDKLFAAEAANATA